MVTTTMMITSRPALISKFIIHSDWSGPERSGTEFGATTEIARDRSGTPDVTNSCRYALRPCVSVAESLMRLSDDVLELVSTPTCLERKN